MSTKGWGEVQSLYSVLCYKCQVHSKSEHCYQILFNAMCLVTVKWFIYLTKVRLHILLWYTKSLFTWKLLYDQDLTNQNWHIGRSGPWWFGPVSHKLKWPSCSFYIYDSLEKPHTFSFHDSSIFIVTKPELYLTYYDIIKLK